MKIILQVALLFGICWLSQCVEAVLPFSLPASIIGMAALLVLLGVGVIRTEHIQEKSDFLFVPAVVSIMNYTDVLRSNLVALVVICLVSAVVTFAVTVWAVRLTIRWMERGKR